MSKTAVRQGPIGAEFIPQYRSVLAQADGAVALNVLIRLTATDQGQAHARPPLDLAIVLDRSGSMSGDKLRYAKQAGLDLLSQLDDKDRVTLITYDDVVTTNATRTRLDLDGVEQLRRALLDLAPGGTTALGPALFRALGLLGDRGAGASSLSHVILLSDGLANSGETRPQVIGEAAARGFGAGTSVSTLGMGLDYNEDLMTKVADEGGGRYHFIEDAEHIPGVLTDELAGLTSTVASEVGVQFTAYAPTKVEAVHGYVNQTEGALTQVRVGFLSAGQERDIIARLQIPPAMLQGQAGDTVDLGLITVRFRLIDDNAEPPPMMELSLPARVNLGSSAAEVRASEQTQVTVRVAEIESAAVMQAATAAVDRGDFAAASQVYTEAEASIESKIEAAGSEAEKNKLRSEKAELSQAKAELADAERSVEKRKKYSKQYKSSSYAKGKGSKKKLAPSKKKSNK